jgi:hypothetical protein
VESHLVSASLNLEKKAGKPIAVRKVAMSYVDFWCMKGKEGRAYPAG